MQESRKQTSRTKRVLAGRILRELRDRAELGQKQLAGHVPGSERGGFQSVSHTTISNWERGVKTPSSIEQAEEMFEALGASETLAANAALGLWFENDDECLPTWHRARELALDLPPDDSVGLVDRLAAAAAPSESEPAPSDDAVEAAGSAGHHSGRRGSPWWALATIGSLVVAVVLVAIVVSSNGDDSGSTTPAATVDEESTVITEPEASEPPATADPAPTTSIASTTTSTTTSTTSTTSTTVAPANLTAITPIDITFHCRERYGLNATARPIPGSIQWQCDLPGQPDPVEPFIDLEEVCGNQVGPGARAVSLNSSSAFEWRCVFELQDTTPDSGGCTIEAGEAVPGLALPEGIDIAIADAWPGEAVAPCPAAFVRRLEGGYIQELGEVGGIPTAAIFSAIDAAPVFLDGGPWRAWERLVQGLPPAFGGLPTSAPELVGDTYTVTLSTGSVLISGDLVDEFYPLFTFSYPRWLESGGRSGCLGLPTSDPGGDASGFSQQFERGSMFLDLTGSGELFLFDQNGEECEPGS